MPRLPSSRHRTPALAAIACTCVVGIGAVLFFRDLPAFSLNAIETRHCTAPALAVLAVYMAGMTTGTRWRSRRKALSSGQWRKIARQLGAPDAASAAFALVSASRIVDANQAFSRLTGYGAGIPVETIGLRMDALQALARRAGAAFIDTRLQTFGGMTRTARIAAMPARPSGRRGLLLSIEDSQPAAPRQEPTDTDPLTGLPGRHAMERHMAVRIGSHAGRTALLSLDLDRFHVVNDMHGYTIGDEIVCRVGERLRAAIPSNAVIGRMGGDKFCILASIDRAEDAMLLARSAQDAICSPLAIGEAMLHITSGIGVCVSPDDAENPDTARRRADLALHRAKDLAQGTICRFEPFMAAAAAMNASLERDLHGAIQRGELFLEYQPQFGTLGRDLIGFEALLRWRHPKLGIVPPLQFVGLAEQSGLISEIGRWVLRIACAEATGWPPQLRVAVNVSAVQFQLDDMAEIVAGTLRETGLAPHRLELELTETVLLSNQSRNLDMLRRLRALGVPISMDDFGTGYSSLTYLRQFPFNRIKIDRSFVRDMVQDMASRSIVKVIIGMSEALGVAVVAEGVETAAQLDALAELNCDQIQGYLFGRPAPIAQYADLIARSTTVIAQHTVPLQVAF